VSGPAEIGLHNLAAAVARASPGIQRVLRGNILPGAAGTDRALLPLGLGVERVIETLPAPPV
jgi:hypothetical protein